MAKTSTTKVNADILKKKAAACIDALGPELIEISHAIHKNPEIAFEEIYAHKVLTARLESAGITPKRHACGLDTAFMACFGSNDGMRDSEVSPEVGIVSEYDALPGIGHACGHNIIAASGLGAVLGLASLGPALPGRVRYLGTPAEERGGGKEIMAQAGAFDGLDAAMMVHPAGLDLETMPCLAMSEVRVAYTGRAAHAAVMPSEGINALDALVSAYIAIAQLRQHIKFNERIHGVFEETGLVPNVVPERASAVFYVRSGDGLTLHDLRERVARCFEAGALATGCTLEIEWAQSDYLELNHNLPLTVAYRANAESLGRQFFPLERTRAAGAGSTDMGNVSHRVASIHPMIACAPPHIVIHNPEFAYWAGSDLADRAVLDGAKALMMTAIDVMCDHTLREASRAEFSRGASASAKAVAGAWRADGVRELGGCAGC